MIPPASGARDLRLLLVLAFAAPHPRLPLDPATAAQVALLRRLVAGLPLRQRLVAEMVARRRPRAEIARALGVCCRTVDRDWAAARGALQRLLRPEG